MQVSRQLHDLTTLPPGNRALVLIEHVYGLASESVRTLLEDVKISLTFAVNRTTIPRLSRP